MCNILEDFLTIAGVVHTKSFLKKIFEEHPNKYNMLGISQMLKVYGIESVGVFFKQKEAIEIPVPSILHIRNDFVVLSKIDNKNISYTWKGNSITRRIEDLLEDWSGYALVMTTVNLGDSKEPNYNTHKKEQRNNALKKAIAPCMLLFFMVLSLSKTRAQFSEFFIAKICFSIIGLWLCSFLLEKQIFHKSRVGDRMCSMFHPKG